MNQNIGSILTAVCLGLVPQLFAQGEVTIRAIRGEAQYSTNQTEWIPLRMTAALTAPVTIRTRSDSRVDVSLRQTGDIVLVGADTLLEIERSAQSETDSQKETNVELNLPYGSLLCRVRSLPESSKFEVKFPQGVAGVRSAGTFGLRVFAPGESGSNVKLTAFDATMAIATATPDGATKVETIERREVWTSEGGSRSLTENDLNTLDMPRAGAEPGGRPGAIPPKKIDPRMIKVFYATNRKEAETNVASKFYGFERDETSELKYGVAFINIPPDHRMAELESPRWFLLEFEADPQKHVTLERVHSLATNKFFTGLSNAVSRAERREIFIFVHGFANTFEDTARRTGQLAYDLGFKGVPMFFSWPSLGDPTPLGYTKDLASADFSISDLAKFLEGVSQQAGAERIYLIAHSMGNRVLSFALKDLAAQNRVAPFKEIVLTAPDVEALLFKRELLAPVKQMGHHITLYASSRDRALKLSKKAQGYPRAGDTGTEILISPPMDTIDVSALESDFLEHSYYGDNSSVVTDLISLLQGATPKERKLVEANSSGNVYWKFKK
jgi:esterase/lipase superfamily enzyme